MSAWAAWAALGLVLILWVFLLVAFVLLARFWAQIGPTLRPMLAMMSPPAPKPAHILLEQCDYGDNGKSCYLTKGHEGEHDVWARGVHL